MWPQSVNGMINNSSGTITGGGNTEWSQNSSAAMAAVATVHHSRIPHQTPHDVTGTAHWSAGAPPPSMIMNNGSVVPPATGPAGNWCQPGIGNTGPPAPDGVVSL